MSRGINILNLDYVRDPDSAVQECLNLEHNCENALGLFYTGWTVFFKTLEREVAASKLLSSLDKRGLSYLRPILIEKAEEQEKGITDEVRNLLLGENV